MYQLLHELANVLKLWILGNFKEILEISGIKYRCPAGYLISKFWQLRQKIAKKKKKRRKTDLKYFTYKPNLLVSRICLQYFVQDWRHFCLLLPKYNMLPQISQLKCKSYNAGFDSYHKIAVRDYVRVSNYGCAWRAWANTKKHISGVIIFT